MLDSAESTHRNYCFGPFRLDTTRQQLYRDSQLLEVSPRLVRTLQLLVENYGKDLDKGYLIEQLWPNTVVEERNLAVAISTLRKVLGDDVEHKKYILTIPGRGYRFVAEVTEPPPSEPSPQPSQIDGSVARSPEPPPALHRFFERYGSFLWSGLAAALFGVLALFGWHEWNKRTVVQSIAVLPF